MSRKKYRNDNSDTESSSNSKLNKEFKPLTKGQEDYVRCMIESTVTFCTGPAGSGKTHCAIGLACDHLQHDKVKKIVITRPMVQNGYHSLGAMPGGIYDKVLPYTIPVLEEMIIYLGKYRTDLYIQNGTVDIVPLEVMRGRNFHNSFVLLDEGQNCTLSQIKMFLTRIGRNSKAVVTGDLFQSDLPNNQIGLTVCMDKLKNVNGVALIELNYSDIIRNSLIARILEKLE
jgi:phosphate starvation-inducible PhoH-like protein